MKRLVKVLLAGFVIFNLNGISAQASASKINFTPIAHASFVIDSGKTVIFVDPTGSAAEYEKFKAPDIILITHSHFDHFDKDLVGALKKKNTLVAGPKDVIQKLGYGKLLNNGDITMYGAIKIEAMPAYNTTAARLMNHPQGAGNGYIVTVEGKRVYISGDTEDTPEMRGLKDIDYAFVCMNLPYTMSVEQAAAGVLAFKPKVVFPYHYRQRNGFADVYAFKELVGQNKNIEVRILKWYK